MTFLWFCRVHFNHFEYHTSSASIKSVEVTRSRSESFFDSRLRCFSGGRKFKHINGVTVRETKNEPNNVIVIVMVSGINSNLATPERNTIGRNTITVVNVEMKMGAATSFAASSVAVIFD